MKRDWDLVRSILMNVEEDNGIYDGLDIPAGSR